jgi:hypothetical protein
LLASLSSLASTSFLLEDRDDADETPRCSAARGSLLLLLLLFGARSSPRLNLSPSAGRRRRRRRKKKKKTTKRRRRRLEGTISFPFRYFFLFFSWIRSIQFTGLH